MECLVIIVVAAADAGAFVSVVAVRCAAFWVIGSFWIIGSFWVIVIVTKVSPNSSASEVELLWRRHHSMTFQRTMTMMF